MNINGFYREGSTLLYVKEKKVHLIFILLAFLTAFGGGIFGLPDLIVNIILVLFGLWYVLIILTPNKRPHYSRFHIFILNNELYFERITPSKEGFKEENVLVYYNIIKFLDEKGNKIKVIAKKELPWDKEEVRNVYVSKEYLPYKSLIIDYLNNQFTEQ